MNMLNSLRVMAVSLLTGLMLVPDMALAQPIACGTDTLDWALSNTTSVISFENAPDPGAQFHSWGGFAFFPGPGAQASMTLSGVRFNAFLRDSTSATMAVRVAVYRALADSTPNLNQLLAQDTLLIDTAGQPFGSSFILNRSFRFASFPPVAITGAYVAVIQGINPPPPSNNSWTLMSNNVGDGQGLFFSGTIFRATANGTLFYDNNRYVTLSSGETLDADYLIDPIVTVTLNNPSVLDLVNDTICTFDTVLFDLSGVNPFYLLPQYNLMNEGFILYTPTDTTPDEFPINTYFFDNPGTYQIETTIGIATAGFECGVVEDTLTLVVNDSPFLEAVDLGGGFVGTDLNNSGPAPVSGLTFYVNGVAQPAGTDTLDLPEATGTYQVYAEYIDAATGCSDESNMLTINISTVGIEDGIAAMGLRMYPNPATGRVNLSATQTEEVRVRVMNMAGQSMLNTHLQIGNTPASLDLTALPAGIYFLQVEMDGRIGTEKLVVH